MKCSLCVLQLTPDKPLHRNVPGELRGDDHDPAAGTGPDVRVVLTRVTDQVAVDTLEDLLGRTHHLQTNWTLELFLQSGVLNGTSESPQSPLNLIIHGGRLCGSSQLWINVAGRRSTAGTAFKDLMIEKRSNCRDDLRRV